ncbi:MAG: hypothetical protein M1818_005891 [Claussenomyces sp. TS43310]|nr:MAG: hypothetical protein M1818_005891 [Claussenomyces sp. TS43310]
MALAPTATTVKVKAVTPQIAVGRHGPWQTQQNGGPARSLAQHLPPARLEVIAAQTRELAAHVGDRVKITNTLSREFVGTIYFCDTELALETGPTDFHLIPVSKILKHKFLQDTPEIAQPPAVMEGRGRQKQSPARPSQPEGVSDVGYGLYVTLSKTLQVRWQNKSIVVMDNVRIEPPYNVDTCSAESAKYAKQLERVKQLVKKESLKLEASGAIERRGG